LVFLKILKSSSPLEQLRRKLRYISSAQ
jgi:hypothetical protein